MIRWNLRKAAAWCLFLLALLLVLTGLGITEFRTVEAVTLGVLPKALAFRLHSLLWIPFLAVLGVHLALSCRVGKG